MASEQTFISTAHALRAAEPPANAVLPAKEAAEPWRQLSAAPVSFPRRLLGDYLSRPAAWSSQQVFFLTMSIIAVAYLALYHPYWVRGGDSELYLAIARHLARGEGYRYNGQPVGLVPPGWPIILAAGMWLTSSIALLKLLLAGSILTYLGSAFWVLRRYASAWWCSAAVLAVALAQPTWQLSLWFFSDASFLAVSWLALLLALQARDRHLEGVGGARAWCRIGAVLALLALAISIRWNGVLWWPMLALAFVDRRTLARLQPGANLSICLWPQRIDRMWIAGGLCLIVAVATFFALRMALKVEPTELDSRYGAFESSGYELVNQAGEPTASTHLGRFLGGPQWLGVVWWNQAARARPFHDVMFIIAALTVIPLASAGFVGLVRRQWLWIGAAAAWLPIMITWPHAIDRYTLPVAPFLALGTMLGTAWLVGNLSRPLQSRRAFLALVAGSAAALWGIVWLVGAHVTQTALETAPRVVGKVAGVVLPPASWLPGISFPVLAAVALAALLLLMWLASPRIGRSPGIEPLRLPWLLRWTPVWLVAPAAFVFVSYNMAMYGMEVWVARDPVNRHEAGAQRALTSIGYFLRENAQSGSAGELAVAPVRALNGKRLETLGPRRKAVWLADRPAMDVPFRLANVPGIELGRWNLEPPWAPAMGPEDELDPALIEWLRSAGVRWYVVMPMQQRFLHMTRPPLVPPPSSGGDLPSTDTDWRLYEITPDSVRRVEARDRPGEVLIVPGLEDVARVAGGRARLPIPYN